MVRGRAKLTELMLIDARPRTFGDAKLVGLAIADQSARTSFHSTRAQRQPVPTSAAGHHMSI
jgi:hypothetical protein